MSESPDNKPSNNAGHSNYGYDDHTDSLAFFNGQEALDCANFMAAANNFTLLIERHPHRDPQYRWLRRPALTLACVPGSSVGKIANRQNLSGMVMPQVSELGSFMHRAKSTGRASATRAKIVTLPVGPELLTLVSLRQKYRLRSLLISADEHLAERAIIWLF